MALLPTDFVPAADLLDALLDVSPNGVIFLRPLYAPGDETTPVDFAYVQLNAAAQRLLELPAQPAESFLARYPHALATGVFAFYRDAFLAGGSTRQHDTDYRHDGVDSYFHLAARRSGELLVVSFSTAGDQERAAIGQALRQSQEREQAALAEAQRQRGELERIFEQAPMAIAVYRGPRYVIELANSLVLEQWGRTREQAIGTPLFELLPEIVGQGFEELLDEVVRTGTPYVAREMHSTIERRGRLENVYWNFVYLPVREENGRISGAMVVANEVTEQVEARQQVQQLNEQLEAVNQALHASNADLIANQEEVLQVQDRLDARVSEHTRQAASALAEAGQQRSRLERLIQEAPAAICVLDGPAMVFELVNPRYQALFPDRELIGKPVLEALPEIAGTEVETMLRGVYDTGATFQGNEIAMRFARPGDGVIEERFFNFIYQARYDAAGAVDGLMVFAFEVTELARSRRQAETLQAAVLAASRRQVQERETLYQLFARTPAAVAILRGPEHRYEYANETFKSFVPGRVVVGRPAAEAIPEATEQGLLALVDQVYRTGEPYYGYEVPLTLHGPGDSAPRTYYYTFTYQALREGGQVAGVSIFAHDVTEQVQAKQRIEEQRRDLQRIFEQAPVAIAIMRGPELTVELANTAVASIWGRPAAQVVGRPYFEALPDTAGQGFEEILAGVLATGEPFFITEAPVTLDRAHTGQPTQAYVNFTFQPLAGSDRPGLIAVGTEVTEQVLARQQVQQLNEQLEATNADLQTTNTRLTRTNADLDTFVYAASHDLKAPIANIEGLLDALRDYLPVADTDPMVPRLLGMMRNAVTRFQQTVGHLTDVSRLAEASEQPAAPESLLPIIKGVQFDLADLLEAARAQVLVDVEDCPRIALAAKSLRSIIFNLLSNAVKYRDPARPPQVQVRARCSATEAVLEVQDNGLGLSQAQQSRLFVMFRRLHDHVEGSGVGLYVVKKLAENAGGRVEVESALGVGSTFRVVLPLPAHLA